MGQDLGRGSCRRHLPAPRPDSSPDCSAVPPAFLRPRSHRAGSCALRVDSGRAGRRAALMLPTAASLPTGPLLRGPLSAPSPLPHPEGRSCPVNEAVPPPCPEPFGRSLLPCSGPGCSRLPGPATPRAGPCAHPGVPCWLWAGLPPFTSQLLWEPSQESAPLHFRGTCSPSAPSSWLWVCFFTGVPVHTARGLQGHVGWVGSAPVDLVPTTEVLASGPPAARCFSVRGSDRAVACL